MGWLNLNLFNQPGIFTNCGSVRLFGGWLSFGGKNEMILKVDNIPNHFMVHIYFKYMLIDSLGGEPMLISINSYNDKIQFEWNIGYARCGQNQYKEDY